ncbi:zincin-like metallopeptidase toxin domain-containing protein [Flavobacterium sp. DGU11]|uniref:Zincin-like metallopeptidase toxin domain-containing protein n=1 Tax=Flavobacterium arundinis TaxID=3139143 RepID=A0ABU9I0Y0_9FLAO
MKGELKFTTYQGKGYALVYKGEVIAEGTVKDLIREVFDIWKKAGKQANLSKYLDLTADNIKKYGLFGGKILSESEIARHATELLQRFGTKIKKVDEFADEGVEARFIAELNTIEYKEGVTNYILRHESFHAEECFILKKAEYLKGSAQMGGTDAEQLLRTYRREKYVYEQIKKHAKKQKFNNHELIHNERYIDWIEYQLVKNKIEIPK